MSSIDAQGPREQLLAGLRALADDDLLALAYAFAHSPGRLRLYLEVFRARTGARAQLAASLICYDLAAHGDAAMGEQFAYLRGTIESLMGDQALVGSLMGDNPYLRTLWGQCTAALAQSAHADEPPELTPAYLTTGEAPLAGSLQLLQDDDLPEAALQVDVEALWQRYIGGCAAFFGGGPGQARYDAALGFRLGGTDGQARAEAFLQVLEACREHVRPARGMRPLLLLAWGQALRPRNFFGQLNRRREALLASGLRAYAEAHLDVATVADVLGPLSADAHVWPRMAALLQAFVVWRGDPRHAGAPLAEAAATFVATEAR